MFKKFQKNSKWFQKKTFKKFKINYKKKFSKNSKKVLKKFQKSFQKNPKKLSKNSKKNFKKVLKKIPKDFQKIPIKFSIKILKADLITLLTHFKWVPINLVFKSSDYVSLRSHSHLTLLPISHENELPHDSDKHKSLNLNWRCDDYQLFASHWILVLEEKEKFHFHNANRD